MAAEEKPLIRDLSADDDPEITEIESLCMNCHEQGLTRMLITRIPFFRDVIIASFKCDECHYSNTELMPASNIGDRGINIKIEVSEKEDLNRQVVASKSCSMDIPELELNIPPSNGALTTVEGILQKTRDELEFNQPVRRVMEPTTAKQIDDFIAKVKTYQELQHPFTLILDDPSGNSFVENRNAPQKDPAAAITHYKRTKKQNESIGILVDEESEDEDTQNAPDEVMSFMTNCTNCKAQCETRMKPIDIPFFKDVIIMATNCEQCGYRDNEVKSGGGIEPFGTKITLRFTDVSDLSRDVLMSETCSLQIPELEFETEGGSIGGKFTTLEGILTSYKEKLLGKNPFFQGDSSNVHIKSKISLFCDKLDQIIAGKWLNVHLVLDDPAGNSYVQNVYAPEDDPELKIEKYTRSYEHMEKLGLNDMKTENYEIIS